MSGFQLYKFKSIDRPLTKKEQEEVNSWSSRGRVNATSATFIYHYGDFRKNEEQALADYFDAMLYVSNYGTQRLMFRFPLDAIDRKKIQEFEAEAETGYTTHLQLNKKGNYWLLDFYWADDEGGGWMEEEDYELEDFLEIRAQILRGDYRALYLFWMKLTSFNVEHEVEEYDYTNDDDFDEDYEKVIPPVPANLGKLNGTLDSFVTFYGIDKDLIAAAASFSTIEKADAVDYAKLVGQLSEEERMDFLIRLAKGEKNMEITMNYRLRKLMEKEPTKSNGNRPSPIELLAKSKEKESVRLEKEAALAKIAYEKKMQGLAGRKDGLWREVYYNIELKSSKGYDRATTVLKDLKDLAVYEKEIIAFKERMMKLKTQFGRSTALMGRFQKARLFD